MEPFDEQAWREGLLRQREATRALFLDPWRSPFAAVARHDFAREAPLIFGSDEGCDVPLAGLLPRHLAIRVVGGEFQLEALSPEASFQILQRGEGPALRTGRVPPGARIRVGRYGLRLSHQNVPAAIVFDPESPRLAAGEVPLWFEPDLAFRVEARLLREPEREEQVLSTLGHSRRALRLGQLAFQLDGGPMRLSALRLLEPGADEQSISLYFRDATTGRESYPVGRYLDPTPLEREGASDRWLLDFNTAYNPACAWSPLYNCPIPPRENLLPTAVRAGQRDLRRILS